MSIEVCMWCHCVHVYVGVDIKCIVYMAYSTFIENHPPALFNLFAIERKLLLLPHHELLLLTVAFLLTVTCLLLLLLWGVEHGDAMPVSTGEWRVQSSLFLPLPLSFLLPPSSPALLLLLLLASRVTHRCACGRESGHHKRVHSRGGGESRPPGATM
jgi:hypothetical protein